MFLSAASRNGFLVPLAFLTGVWIGQNRLGSHQPDGRENPGSTEFRSELKQRTTFGGGRDAFATRKDCRTEHFGSSCGNVSPGRQNQASSPEDHQQVGDVARQQKLADESTSRLHPSWENKDGRLAKESLDTTERLAPSDEFSSDSYSFYERIALENNAIEPSYQSIESDILTSLKDAGISPEEIPQHVEGVMEMILHNEQHRFDAYPDISTSGEDP
ncbi:hypothetical protein [Methylotetracoccus oryzae]|uniref:hypothetical protein n=1 Tax=Methylotetracoccus oryzae TaxID=1919059 RepID=UPI00111841C0|nr:hypothetical protein [Methylotetracoccus oryzae]